mgnify:CR=1 FL=1|jgi:hypothetical protein
MIANILVLCHLLDHPFLFCLGIDGLAALVGARHVPSVPQGCRTEYVQHGFCQQS